MAQLILSLPEDIVERMRLSAPRSLWQRWIESAEFVGPAPDGGARCVEDALKALRRLEARGEIWVQEDNETFVRPAQIRAAVWKKNRAIVGRRLKAKIQAAAKVKQMKELL